MNKKILAVLIATLPVAAMADVTIYGAIKLGVENGKSSSANASVNKLGDLGSKIGFKGNEDLGNGLKAIWQVETRLSADGEQPANNTRNRFATRDTFVGLASAALGTVKLGYNSNFSNSDMAIVNPWNNESSALGLDIFTRADTRFSNSVRYESPELSGAKLVFVHGVDEAKTAGQPNKYVNSLGAQYAVGNMVAQYQYQAKNDAMRNNKNSEIQQRLELGYTLDSLFVAFGVAKSKSADGASDYVGLTDAVITATYSMGNITPKFSYAKSLSEKSNGETLKNTGYTQYIAGVDYSLSKRTAAGVSFGRYNEKVKGKKSHERALGVQLMHSF